jgi:2-oxoglutarate ferredoxin oxidoreductase subunit beta
MLATLATPGYLERVTVHTPQQIIRAKRAIRKAFRYQAENRCFSLIEILSTCPTNWGLTPGQATDWLADNLMKYYSVGCLKTPEDDPEK